MYLNEWTPTIIHSQENYTEQYKEDATQMAFK